MKKVLLLSIFLLIFIFNSTFAFSTEITATILLGDTKEVTVGSSIYYVACKGVQSADPYKLKLRVSTNPSMETYEYIELISGEEYNFYTFSGGIKHISSSQGCQVTLSDIEFTDITLTCEDDCSVAFQTGCVDNSVYKCSLIDGCLKYVEVEPCGSDFQCVDGSCSQKVCHPDDYHICYNGDVYWYDSCDKRGALKESCDPDEVCDGGWCVTDCSPSHYEKRCYKDQYVYWYDSCGQRQDLYEKCDDDEICQNAKCIQKEINHFEKKCFNNDVYWYNNQGIINDLYEDCDITSGCENGKCICNSKASFRCRYNNVYWFDSCGNRENKKTDCKSDETCVDNSCIKIEEDNFKLNDEYTKYPIIFVHGWSGNLKTFKNMQEQMHEEGFAENNGEIYYDDEIENICKYKLNTHSSFNLEYYHFYYHEKGHLKYVGLNSENSGIEEYAKRLNDVIDIVKSCTNSNKVNIIAHSMGGLVSRQYMLYYGSKSINLLITLATPHYGTNGALFLFDYSKNGGDLIVKEKNYGLDAKQMEPNSPFLSKLNLNDCNNRNKIISLGANQEKIEQYKEMDILWSKIFDCESSIEEHNGVWGRTDGIVAADSAVLKGSRGKSKILNGEDCSHSDIHETDTKCGKEAYGIIKSSLSSIIIDDKNLKQVEFNENNVLVHKDQTKNENSNLIEEQNNNVIINIFQKVFSFFRKE